MNPRKFSRLIEEQRSLEQIERELRKARQDGDQEAATRLKAEKLAHPDFDRTDRRGDAYMRTMESTSPEDAAHHALWDKAVAKAEEEGEGTPALTFIDFVAEVYNGGIQQVIEHDKVGELGTVMAFLRQFAQVPQAMELFKALQAGRDSIRQAADAYKEDITRSREGRGGSVEGDVFGDFVEDFDVLEDWMYKHVNLDPILQAYVGDSDFNDDGADADRVQDEVDHGPLSDPPGARALS